MYIQLSFSGIKACKEKKENILKSYRQDQLHGDSGNRVHVMYNDSKCSDRRSGQKV